MTMNLCTSAAVRQRRSYVGNKHRRNDSKEWRIDSDGNRSRSSDSSCTQNYQTDGSRVTRTGRQELAGTFELSQTQHALGRVTTTRPYTPTSAGWYERYQCGPVTFGVATIAANVRRTAQLGTGLSRADAGKRQDRTSSPSASGATSTAPDERGGVESPPQPALRATTAEWLPCRQTHRRPPPSVMYAVCKKAKQ